MYKNYNFCAETVIFVGIWEKVYIAEAVLRGTP